MTIPVNITKKIQTITIGNRTVTLKPNETQEQAIARVQNPQANDRGRKEGREEEVEKTTVEEAR